MIWTSRSVFVDVDTGEILNVSNERQLKYLNYRVINKFKKFKGDESKRIIEYTNECRFTGQRELKFE